MNVRLRRVASRLGRDDRGLTTVEYVIVLCLIAALAVASWKTFGENVHAYLNQANRNIESAIEP